MWLRYVGNVHMFTIWPNGDHLVEEFHLHLNQQKPAIQTTMKVSLMEKYNSSDLSHLEADSQTVPQFQLPPSRKGHQRCHAVLEGQSGEGIQ